MRDDHRKLTIDFWAKVPLEEFNDMNWHRFTYGEDTVSFYPDVEPVGLLFIEVEIFIVFLHVTAVLFLGDRPSRRGRRVLSE